MKVKEMFRRGLACLLIAAMMPQQTIAFAAEQASSARNKKEDVLVRWIPGETVIEPGEKGTIKLEARINKKNVEHAEVSIHLDPSEVFALCDEKLEDDSRIGIDWLDDGGADLYFELDEDTPRLSRKIYFQMPTDSIFDIDVTPEDIDVVAYGPEESDEDTASPSDAAKAAASPSEIIEYSETAEEIAATSSEASKSETIKSETTKSEATGSAATSSEADKVETDEDSDDENAATESNIGDSKHVKITTEGGFVIRRETQALRVKGIRPEWKMNVKAKSGSSTSEDTLDFALTASPKNRRSSKSLADKEQTLTLTVTVPEWLNIRSGEVTWNQEDEQLLVDGTTIATLKGIPEEFVLTDAEISDEHTIAASFERIQGEEDIVTILENEEYEEANGPAVVMLDADDVEIEDTGTSIAPDASDETVNSLDEDGDLDDYDITPVAELSKLNISLSLYKSAPVFEISDDFDLAGTNDETYGTVLLEANLVTTSAGLSDTVSADANSEIALADYVENGEETIKVDKTTSLTENIYWIDNGNASGIRPDSNSDSGYLSVCKPVIYFTEDESTEKIALTEANWKTYFYPDDSGDEGGSATKAVPSTVYNGGTTGTSASLELSDLPTKTTVTKADGTNEVHTYNWKIELTNFGEKETSGNYTSKYSMLHVTDDNKDKYPSASATGWYYVERENLNFNIDVKAGDKAIDAEKLLNAIKDTFDFQLNYSGGNTSEKTFDDISGKQTATYNSDKKIYNFNIEGLWKYNLDGTSITYSLQEKTDRETAENGRISGTVLGDAIKDIDEDDYLKISYDNSSVPNYGSVITELHNGGTLDLTLKGSTEYEASKVWADKADPTKRPTGTFELWRYRKGQSYTDAAPVRDAKGSIVSKQIGQDTADSESNVAYQERISFGNQNTETDSLEKYDPEGYEYVYVTREYLDSTTKDGTNRANSYEQIYGEITADASTGKESIRDVVEDTSVKRDYLTGRGDSSSSYESGTTHSEIEAYVSGNDWVYNGGTLTNRLKDQITVEGVKHWQAKAFQDDLKNVTATMTLYSKKAGDSDSGWTVVDNVKPVVLTGFQNETIENNSFSVTMPQYDSDGNKLLYRWIETSVTQTDKDGNTVDTKFTRSNEQNSGFLANLLGTGDKVTDADQRAVFELKHIGETYEVPYESTSKYDAATGVSSIYNAIEDTVTFTLEKTWDENMATYPVQFSLYRTTGSGDGQKLGTFSLDGNIDSEGTWTPEGNVADSKIIEGKETENWTTVLNNLPKYDSNGRLYQYYVTEAKNAESLEFITPTYETNCDESGNWITNVHNGNGNGKYIWIRKDWLDDGDSAHREPVTVGIYQKVESSGDDSYKKLTSAGDNGNVTLSAGNAWYVRVGIGNVNPSNIYIVEEKVGNNDILTVDDTTGVAGVVNNGHEYQTAYHHYKVTYNKDESDGSEPVFVVQNRRVGTIDYTVTKQWKDGDGSRRAALKAAVDAINAADTDGNKKIDLIVRLKFQSDYGSSDADDQKYAISKDGTAENGDTVTINQDGATQIYKHKNSDGSYQENGKSWYSVLDGMNSDSDSSSDSDSDSNLSLDSGTNYTEEFYFFNLPKYGYSGANVGYTVEELWVDKNGNKVTDLSQYSADVDGQEVKLSDLWADYSMSLSGASYDIGECYTGDTQKITMTNRLSGTKNLLWHKQWQDDYNYTSGQRPDIYLSIYCGRANDSDNIKEYSTQYRWTTPSNKVADDDEMSILHHWHAVVSCVPMYDEDGYELKYFALENTKVNKDNFDYEVAKYSLAGEENSGNDVNSGTITGSSQTGQVIGTEYEITNTELSSYVRDVSSLTGSSSSKYALAEGGTITNRIKNEVTIKGRKLWKNLPENFWKDEKNIDSLPSVTLHVKRKLANASEETPATEVASLTIKNTDWKYLGSDGSYEFTLEREGNYEYAYDTASGTLVLKLLSDNGNTGDDVTTKEPLQRYNERGVLYKYSITEDMNWGDDVSDEGRATNPGDVYQSSVSAYVLTNNYDSVKGALKVKKLLELPVNTTNFPAIKMELTRTFEAKNNSGAYIESADDSFKKTQVWSAEDVKKAFEAAKADTVRDENAATSVLLDSTSVSGSTKDPFLFENLDKYAPNGMPYKYYVKEIKDGYLDGYDTWVVTENVNASDENAKKDLKTDNNKYSANVNVGVTLTENKDDGRGKTADDVRVCATYLNSPNSDPEKIKINGQKIWTRYSFENPPSTDEFSSWLTLWRSADSQPGQNNAIELQQVTDVIFKSVSTPDPVGESGVLTTTYHYGVYNLDTATDIESDLSTDPYAELDRYAPNGMPWKYVVRETIPNENNSGTNWMQYFSPTGDSSRNVVEVQENSKSTDSDGTVHMYDLNNTGLTSVSYSKSWVDQDGNPITADYTGLGTLKVNFELQVKKGTSGSWQNAAEYFTDNKSLGNSAKISDLSVQGNILSSVWGKSQKIDNLPRFVYNITSATSGEYIPLSYRVVEKSVSTVSAPNVENTIVSWNVTDTTDGKGYTLTSNSDSTNSDTSSASANNKTENMIEPYYGKGSSGAALSYHSNENNNHTNKLKLHTLTIKKKWENDRNNLWGSRPASSVSGKDWSAWFLVQRREKGTQSAENEGWENVKEYNSNGSVKGDRIITVSGKNSDNEVSTEVTGLLETAPSGNAYEYRFVELADSSANTENVIESTAPTGYSVTIEAGTGANAGTFTATNKLDITQVNAGKKWVKNDACDSISLRLTYEGTDGKYYEVKNSTVTLDGKKDDNPASTSNAGSKNNTAFGYEDESWHARWILPKKITSDMRSDHTEPYTDDNGNTIYAVEEINNDGTGNTCYRQLGEKVVDSTGETIITNMKLVKLNLSKIWRANEDAKKEVAITIYRIAGSNAVSDDDSSAEEIGTVALNASNKWSFSGYYLNSSSGVGAENRVYFDKYKVNSDGSADAYLYYAREVSVGGTAVQTDGKVSTDGKRYEVKTQTVAFTDVTSAGAASSATVEERSAVFTNFQLRDIEVKKIWNDNKNAYNTRPESLTVRIWRTTGTVKTDNNGSLTTTGNWVQVGNDVTLSKNNESLQNSDIWVYTWKDLPYYDENGSLYTYKVEEVVPTVNVSAASHASEAVYKCGGISGNGKNTAAVETKNTGTNEGKAELKNTLTRQISVSGIKYWADGDNLRPDDITLTLKRTTEDNVTADSWTDIAYTKSDDSFLSSVADAVRTLFAGSSSSDSGPELKWTKDGNTWTYTFSKLEGYNSDGKRYVYKVEEIVPEGYRNEVLADSDDSGLPDLVNIRQTNVSIEKKWYKTDDITPESVKVKIYRTTDNEIPADASLDGNGTSEYLGDVELNQMNNFKWSGSSLEATTGDGASTTTYFDSYKIYDSDGKPVTKPQKHLYYAREYQVKASDEADNISVTTSSDGYITVNSELFEITETGRYSLTATSGQLDDSTAVIINRQTTDLELTKTWLDDGNAYKTRPESLSVSLSRFVEDGETEKLSDLSAVVEKNGNKWTFTWKNMPMYDMDGNRYTYVVREDVPEAQADSLLPGSSYICLEADQKAVFDNDGKASLTNLLKKETDLAGQKTWSDGDGTSRPDKIELKLYRRLSGKTDWEEITGAKPTWYKQSDGTWDFIYANILQTNENGIRYYYKVEEIVPDGYRVYYSKDDDGNELTLKNVANGSLTVSKEVKGSGASKLKEFHFTIEVGKLPDGSKLPDGTYGDITFTDSKAEITLKGGESLEASVLPGDITYVVYETEADKGGYVTTSENSEGSILPAGSLDVHFINSKRGGGSSGGSSGGSGSEKNPNGNKPTGPALDSLTPTEAVTPTEPVIPTEPVEPVTPDPETNKSGGRDSSVLEDPGRVAPANRDRLKNGEDGYIDEYGNVYGKNRNPKTGDNADLIRDVLEMFVAGAAVLFLLFYRKKKKKEE